MEKITSYKGFDKDMRCRGFQYKVGESYAHKGAVKACASGFHACEYPLDVLGYYPAGASRFAEVEQSGTLAREGADSKVASSSLSIKAELTLPGLIEAAISYTMSRTTPTEGQSNSGVRGAASNSGYSGAASNSGVRGAASNSGVRGAASNSGYSGAASNSGYSGAASNSGVRGAASNSGYSGAASNSGEHGIAADYSGTGRVRSMEGGAILLVHRDWSKGGAIVRIVGGVAGRDGIKADTWYALDDKGEMVEC